MRNVSVYLGLVAICLIGFACQSSERSNATGLYKRANQGTNTLGLVDSSPASYKRISPTTDVVHTDELYKRDNISGDNTSILWGAITFADY